MTFLGHFSQYGAPPIRMRRKASYGFYRYLPGAGPLLAFTELGNLAMA